MAIKVATRIFVLAMAANLQQPAAAQQSDLSETIQTLSGQARLKDQCDTLKRISDDIVYWQSVAILGATHGWTFAYSGEGSPSVAYTIRLLNTLDESEIFAKRAAQAITRSKVASDEAKAAGALLFEKHLALRQQAQAVYDLLLAGQPENAAFLFRDTVIGLRLEIESGAYSASATIGKDMQDAAMKARLAK